MFGDLRGYGGVAEIAEPEEVTAILVNTSRASAQFSISSEGTLERFTGDELMVVFMRRSFTPGGADGRGDTQTAPCAR